MTPGCPDLKLVALGGLGEIGLNLLVVECGERLLLIDCGLMFPDSALSGIDLILPDIAYLEGREEQIAGILLTHGHEDHIGALPFLWLRMGRPPIYGTRLTLALLKNRLEEHDVNFSGRLHEIDETSRLTLGEMEIEFFAVSHSIGDGVGLALRTPAGLVVHTGDFKLDPNPVDGRQTDTDRLRAYGREGVTLLLADSTNAENPGHSLSESTVGHVFHDILPQCGGRVFLATFSSNIHRLQQAMDAAHKAGRKVAVHGRSMETNVAIARRLGYLKVADTLLVSLKQALTLPPEQVLILTTGSQGEPMSGLLRIALGEHKDIQLQPGDRVILSSKFIPGNERAIGNLINHLYRQGADVDYEKVSEVHVSGHASQEELSLVHRWLKPDYFVPIHGEYRHLVRHARLAEQLGHPEDRIFLLENGHPLVFEGGRTRIEPRIPTGRVLVDGKGVGDLGPAQLRDRRHVAHQGLLVAVVALDRDGAIVYGPELMARGLLSDESSPELLTEATQQLAEMLTNHGIKALTDAEEIQQEMRTQLRRFFNRRLGRRPLVIPRILAL